VEKTSTSLKLKFEFLRTALGYYISYSRARKFRSIAVVEDCVEIALLNDMIVSLVRLSWMVYMKIDDLWHVMSCNLVESYKRFGYTRRAQISSISRLKPEIKINMSSTLSMEIP
jgi:hypothetical protein